ncbi:hypothetical protein EUA04_13505 [Mycolicibacterium obuense]|uniref:Secreted protein n=2 Tax=Mycolicibacterium obuense TaxID=1807 RepID=A0A4R5X6L3_9MYCO|nr:hypothetical protein [Mycolicibacterium obuense]OKH68276.1 hypothetical protein EB72_01720 [Mycobacterium sp. SWH-M1]TDL08450.1 hypothetical protein EUA04_13505 [Mycolicibacterium obuense]
MTMMRTLAAFLLGVCALVGAAAPAQADQVMEGVFTITPEGGKPGTWTIFPSCVPVVGDLREALYLPVGCRMHVQASAGLVGGDAVLTGGQWAYTTPTDRGMQCPDGSWAPTVDVVKFDDVTMTGTRQTQHNGNCGLPPGIITTRFTMAYKEPLATPVDRYPLICEPGGLRRCF